MPRILGEPAQPPRHTFCEVGAVWRLRPDITTLLSSRFRLAATPLSSTPATRVVILSSLASFCDRSFELCAQVTFVYLRTGAGLSVDVREGDKVPVVRVSGGERELTVACEICVSGVS